MIEFNRVTWYSKALAIIMFIGVIPAWMFFIGMRYQEAKEDIVLDSQIVLAPHIKPVLSTVSVENKDLIPTKNSPSKN